MGLSVVVDYGTDIRGSGYLGQIGVASKFVDFDPSDSDATIKTAIETLSTMASHSVTVTTLIAGEKWQLDFDFTPTNFSALIDDLVCWMKCNEGTGNVISDATGNLNGGTCSGVGWTSSVNSSNAADLTFSNPYAIDLSDGKTFTAGANIANFLDLDTDGIAMACRFQMPASPAWNFPIDLSGNSLGFGYYSTYGLYTSINSAGGAGFAWTPDTDWHIMSVDAGAASHALDQSVYYDLDPQALSMVVSNPQIYGVPTSIYMGQYSGGGGSNLAGLVDNIQIWRKPKGATHHENLNSYNPPLPTVTVLGSGYRGRRQFGPRTGSRLTLAA
jgi:hypothetical protein